MKYFGPFLVFTLLVAAIGLKLYEFAFKPEPPKHFNSINDHFKYGSIGAEVNGYPFLIWQELPTLFEAEIPGGFSEFGFIEESGKELPLGVSVRRYSVDRVGFNCSTCHTTKVEFDGLETVYMGAPANQLRLQSYIRFLTMASYDPRLTADAVIESAKKNNRRISWYDRVILKQLVFPRLEVIAEDLEQSNRWMDVRPDHGPGRTDAGNTWRSRWKLSPEKDDLTGVTDHPAIWNQRDRNQGGFHWDGNNKSLQERNISAALAGGAHDWMFQSYSVERVSEWLDDLPAPKYPSQINKELAQIGNGLYITQGCQSCHDPDGEFYAQVTPSSELKTSPERSNLFSKDMVERFQVVGKGYSWQFKNYRVTDGYVNAPLDGIWLRAPYLHNGSVPNLMALLDKPNERPSTFIRGCADYDLEKVGFHCEDGFLLDTSLKGNSNSGHNYGTDLSDEDKLALIEYLKTK